VVEQAIAQPIEEQVNGVEGMLYMSSSSSGNGGYNLDITFGLENNADIAAVQVQNRSSQANARLPSEAISAGITTKKQTPDVLMYLALVSPNGTYDELFLANYATINVVEAIKRIKGVGNVSLFGAEFGMRLWLRPDRMASLGVTPIRYLPCHPGTECTGAGWAGRPDAGPEDAAVPVRRRSARPPVGSQ
jgi:multidrug efflux pump subunit AcrB